MEGRVAEVETSLRIENLRFRFDELKLKNGENGSNLNAIDYENFESLQLNLAKAQNLYCYISMAKFVDI